MSLNRHFIRPLAAGIAVLAALAGCGGGGTAANALASATGARMDAYAGTWDACFPDAGGGGSSAETLAIEKTGATTADFRLTAQRHASADCSGPASGSENDAGSLAIVGTKTISGESVDKVTVTEGGTVSNTVLVIRASGKLHTGSDRNEPGYTADAEGFPETLNAVGYTKR
jgi:hypothetical protein